MRSIFAKILVWFVLALLLVGIVATVAVLATGPLRPIAQIQELATSSEMAGVAAAAAYDNGGQPELAQLLARLQRDMGVEAYLFRGRRELSGQNVPPVALTAAITGHVARTHRFLLREGLLAWPTSIVGPSHHRYVLVVVQRSSMRRVGRTLLFRLGAVALAAILICYWLAANVGRPITQLRQTARRIASGELTARVPVAVTRRGDEIAELGKDFDTMARHLESLIAAQQRLLADISHELRSPLARLGVALAIARRGAGDAAEPALDRIEREADRLNEMIGQLMTLSRLESGLADGVRTPTPLRPLLQEIVADADFEADENGRHVELVVRPGWTDGVVEADAKLLRSGMENVVRNALRYTADGTAVTVALDRNARTARVIVRDHGPGVPPGQLSSIFEPFYRIDDARPRDTGGAGLGLAIADRAVRAHGGTIQAENADGGGLAVTIELSLG